MSTRRESIVARLEPGHTWHTSEAFSEIVLGGARSDPAARRPKTFVPWRILKASEGLVRALGGP